MRLTVKDSTTRTQIVCNDCGRAISAPSLFIKEGDAEYDFCRRCVKERVQISRDVKPFRSP